MKMTSKERVHAALRREPVDRVPIWMWYHPDTTRRLAVELDIPASFVAEAMGDDIRQTWVGGNHAMEGIVHENEGEGHTDVWGIEWVRIGFFNQIRRSPLRGLSEEEVRAYRYPHEHVGDLLTNMEPVLAQGDRYFIGCDISPCLFEMVYRVRGMDDAFLDLVESPELSRFLIDGAAAFALDLAESVCNRMPIDWLWSGDDVAGQQGLMMSPVTWREMIKPHLAEIMAVAKSKDIWMAHHCCGAMRPIIPDLIEIGMDVLNPIQSNVPGMDPLDLKAEFGDDLAFMGGVDTQDLLPNGSATDIYRETERLLNGMTGGGGGYILAASHSVPPETPFENIFAMYEAAGVAKEEIYDRAACIRSVVRSP